MTNHVKSSVEDGQIHVSATSHPRDWRNFVSEDWKGIAHVKREQRELGHKMLFTVEELAEAAGVSIKTLRRRTTAGAMPKRWWDIPRRQYFYYIRDLGAWLDSWDASKGTPSAAATVDAKAIQT